MINAQMPAIEKAVEKENLDEYYQRAMSLVASGRARNAFDLSQEPADLRDKYGRNTFGQSCLLARRLIEAGTRVVEQTTRQKLPEGFHTAEFQLEHGMLDLIVHRRELRDTLATLLKLYTRGLEWQPLPNGAEPAATEIPVAFAVETVGVQGEHG